MIEPQLDTRLKQLIDDAPYGAAAYDLLQRLSIFLTEKFDWAAITLMGPSEAYRLVETLIRHGFLHKYPNQQTWGHIPPFWLDEEVVHHFQPTPTDEERHFAYHAAHLLRKSHGIPHRSLDLYAALVQWTLTHKPEIGLSFAEAASKRYGGTDQRLTNILDEAARQQQKPDYQIGAFVRQARLARHRYDYEAAEVYYRQAVAFDVPQPISEATHLYLYALKFLGHIAMRKHQWAQARALYERAATLREELSPQWTPHRNLLLCLCHVTRQQGDEAAYRRYNKWVSTQWPRGWSRIERELAARGTALDPIPHQRSLFLERLNWVMARRFGSGYILWLWGLFEYEHGDRTEGCALCRLGLLELHKENETSWWRSHVRYSYYTGLQMDYLDELQTYLETLGCDEA